MNTAHHLLQSRFQQIQQQNTSFIHWIQRGESEELAEVASLLGLENLAQEIVAFLNRLPVDQSMDEEQELQNIAYILPDLATIDQKYPQESLQQTHERKLTENSGLAQFAQAKPYEQARQMAGSAHELAELIAILLVLGEFEIAQSYAQDIQDLHLNEYLTLIRAFEGRRQKREEESSQLFQQLIQTNRTLSSLEIVLAMNERLPYEDYPFRD